MIRWADQSVEMVVPQVWEMRIAEALREEIFAFLRTGEFGLVYEDLLGPEGETLDAMLDIFSEYIARADWSCIQRVTIATNLVSAFPAAGREHFRRLLFEDDTRWLTENWYGDGDDEAVPRDAVVTPPTLYADIGRTDRLVGGVRMSRGPPDLARSEFNPPEGSDYDIDSIDSDDSTVFYDPRNPHPDPFR